MKVILYMAMSINGYVTGKDDDTSWISPVEWQNYRQTVADAGAVICGRRTYELALKEGNLLLEEALNVVMTNESDIKSDDKRVLILKGHKPAEVLKILEEKGFEKVIIGGGGILNSAFLKDNLIDEILLDVEPVVMGRGLQLFFPDDFRAKLKLLEIKRLDDNLIQLRYQIDK